MRMKKTYLQPEVEVHEQCTTTIFASSGNFKEGETGHIGVSNEELQGGAMTKDNNWGNIWD